MTASHDGACPPRIVKRYSWTVFRERAGEGSHASQIQQLAHVALALAALQVLPVVGIPEFEAVGVAGRPWKAHPTIMLCPTRKVGVPKKRANRSAFNPNQSLPNTLASVSVRYVEPQMICRGC
jgi:hypothetical protein